MGKRRDRHIHPKKKPDESNSGVQRFVTEYFWFIFKNVIGWMCIIGALPLGLAIPGPGGLPIFLIGFALISFPGKRRLTSSVMRGRPMQVEPVAFTFLITFLAILITASVMWFVIGRYQELLNRYNINITVGRLLGVCALAAAVTWLVMRMGLAATNWLLRRVPRIRRFMRPWLKKWGIHLLPPRRKRGEKPGTTEPRDADEIIVFNESYQRRASSIWQTLKPWLKWLVVVGITTLIFTRILQPVISSWDAPDVQKRLPLISPWKFALAAVMFAAFLFFFRALAWRHILKRMGFKLPVPAATRIWSSSELARYLPGAVFQFVGRAYLVKPYGVRGSVCSVSQILELTIFLLANVILAVSCFVYLGIKAVSGPAETWLYICAALVPVLLLLLHPKVCYGLINRAMAMLGKPPIARPLSGKTMLLILGWNLAGLLLQAAALFLLLHVPLGLKGDWWWILAGSYSLAWTAGFLAVWAPGGIGVRELVFVYALSIALPASVREQFQGAALAGFLGFLSLLLRVWATAGEAILVSLAFAGDFRGSLGDPDAPGRLPQGPSPQLPAAE